MIAQRVEENPFGKVKKMIKDLISKLVQEATEEAEHKGWCDTELTTNQQTRDKKTEEVAQLTQEVEELTAAVAELDAAMAKATADREASKEKNAETIKDAKEAQAAVEAAMAILKEFYAKAAEATALNQQTPAE